MEWTIFAYPANSTPIECISVDWKRGDDCHGEPLHLIPFQADGHAIVPPKRATSARLSFFVHTHEGSAYISVGSCTVSADIHGENRFVLVEDQMDVPDETPAPHIEVLVISRNHAITEAIVEYDERVNSVYTKRAGTPGMDAVNEKLSVNYRGLFIPVFGYCTAPMATRPTDAQFFKIFKYACMVAGTTPDKFGEAVFEDKGAILGRVCTFIALASKYRVDAVYRNGATITCDQYGNPYDGSGDDCEGDTKMCRDSFIWVRDCEIGGLEQLRKFASNYICFAAIIQIVGDSGGNPLGVMQHMAAVLIRKDSTGPALFLEGAAMTYALATGTVPSLPKHVERKLCRDANGNTSGWYGNVQFLIYADEPSGNAVRFAMNGKRIGVPLWKLLQSPSSCQIVNAEPYPRRVVDYVVKVHSGLSLVSLEKELELGELSPIPKNSTVTVMRRCPPSGPVPFFSARIGTGPYIYYFANK